MANTKNYKIEAYIDADGLFRFRILASNGRIVADSAEGYQTKFFCLRNAKKLKEKLIDAPIETTW